MKKNYFMNNKQIKNKMTFFSLRTIFATFCGIIFILFMICSSLAGSGSDHRTVWNAIMGVKNNNGINHPLRDSWDAFQEAIDGKRGDLYITEIIKEFEISHDRRCGHRTYFHWGFHANPKRIKKILDRCINDWDEFPDERQDELLNKLIIDTGKRNKALINELKTATKLTRSQAGPITAILYDAHILLDWGDPNTRPLAFLNDLFEEMDKDIRKISRGPAKTYNLGKELRKNLKAACHAPGCTDKMKAEKMLDALEQYMPQLLWEKYGNVFPSKMKNIKS
jgi:hypothetical protein